MNGKKLSKKLLKYQDKMLDRLHRAQDEGDEEAEKHFKEILTELDKFVDKFDKLTNEHEEWDKNRMIKEVEVSLF